jgi:hypothetical protein
MVAGFIASLKLTVMTALGQAPTLPPTGEMEKMVGGVIPVVPGVQQPIARTSTRAPSDQLTQVETLRYFFHPPMYVCLLCCATQGSPRDEVSFGAAVQDNIFFGE